MIELETAADDRIASLRRAAHALRHERSASTLDGRLNRRTRLRLRLGRALVQLGTLLLEGYSRRARRPSVATR